MLTGYFATFALLLLCESSAASATFVHTDKGEDARALADQEQLNTALPVYNIAINLTGTGNVCSDKFLSITLDSSKIYRRWAGFQFESEKVQNLAAALSPIDIRIGGTMANYLTFRAEGLPSSTLKPVVARQTLVDGDQSSGTTVDYEFFLTGEVWTTMTSFFQKAGWDLVFDFNAFKRNSSGWDSTNAKELLDFSAARNIKITGFQVGNEPNSYPMEQSIPPAKVFEDYKQLKNLISNYPLYRNGRLLGPEVTKTLKFSSSYFLKEFLNAGACNLIDQIGFHHYYAAGATAQVEDFLDVNLMDELKISLQEAMQLSRSCARPIPVGIGETASFFNGGAPQKSDRYMAGFLWLDKLGLAAQYGLVQLFRQDFWGGQYGLISNTMDPNPDYYLSLLFKKLVHGSVFEVNVEPSGQNLRVYANCAKQDTYPAGAIVLYYLNVGNVSATLNLSQFRGLAVDFYQLTPGDSLGLASTFIKLNGQTLIMSGSQLPKLLPKPYRGPLVVLPLSFGFIVVPGAGVPACK